MARRDALLRLHKNLTNRRTELRKRLGDELEDLRGAEAGMGGDSADAAFDSGSEEIASQLAELEARELLQIERALARMKQGTYGLCEGCQSRIPIIRLNALPYSTTCIECQREFELYGGWSDRRSGSSWEKISEVEARLEDRQEVNLADIELDLSK